MKAERAASIGPSRTGAAAVLVVAILAVLGLSMVQASAQSATTTSIEADTVTQPSLVVAPSTAPESDTTSSSSSGLSTDTKLAMVVGGLVAVGVIIGVLTFFYWRHTRPSRYRVALDALADIDDGSTTDAGGVGNERSDADDPVTGEIPAFVAAPARSVRIIEPAEPEPVESEPAKPDPTRPDPARPDPGASEPFEFQTLEPPEPGVDGPTPDGPPTERFDLASPARAASPVDDVACIRETLFGSGLPEVRSSSLVTLEDLFGPNDDTKGTVQR